MGVSPARDIILSRRKSFWLSVPKFGLQPHALPYATSVITWNGGAHALGMRRRQGAALISARPAAATRPSLMRGLAPLQEGPRDILTAQFRSAKREDCLSTEGYPGALRSRLGLDR